MIRQERASDYNEIHEVIKEAFKTVENSDHREPILVDKLRQTDAYMKELALVYIEDNKIVGHICYSECFIGEHPVLALAPVSVLPAYQNKGIGTALIEASLERAKWSGFSAVIVVGHADYYPRFGFQQVDTTAISLPFEVPAENFMILPLYKGSLTDVMGEVVYAAPFTE
ncbi:GNAT family N-acetyltransferase [Kurthia sibirica]|uniref:GNAT family N-acetyltransferase n=1 Tax=Kurthia sibirica TaxID=202750 RepID=A0A2U3AP66_9BACL|nr:N-acetyltransferase [Kurthia sibirica]PWI26306.1 GNAT family N-acetyltransferase [Kurthia sibirica]GEK35025.1 N-acetyltransferase [Kurthia sibirica]